MLRKAFYIIYGFLCYFLFFGTFAYLIGFVENVNSYQLGSSISQLFPKTLDSGVSQFSTWIGIMINLLLIAIFGIQHSVMARTGFKEIWTRIIPKPIERSTYVLFASLALILLMLFWQPISITLWDFSQSTIGNVFLGISLFGWGLLILSTYQINHFELFGLKQVFYFARHNKTPEPISFQKPGLYSLIRHPIYFSFLLAFWFAPIVTLSHAIFTIGMTMYIFIGIYHEEKDLIAAFGEKYRSYRGNVPKIIPFIK